MKTLALVFLVSIILPSISRADDSGTGKRDLRQIGNAVYDFSGLIALGNKRRELLAEHPKEPNIAPPTAPSNGGQYRSMGQGNANFAYQQQQADYDSKMQSYRKAYEEWSVKFEALTKLLDAYYVKGRVLQIMEDGMRVQVDDSENGDVLLKNYHKPGRVVDGDQIGAFALDDGGTYRYVTITGATRTIKEFDCGVPVQDNGQAADFTLPYKKN